MAATSTKAVTDRVEEAHPTSFKESWEKDGDVAQHGDRALALIGNERVSLTEEDVRRYMLM